MRQGATGERNVQMGIGPVKYDLTPSYPADVKFKTSPAQPALPIGEAAVLVAGKLGNVNHAN
jgi:hypothetical protein